MSFCLSLELFKELKITFLLKEALDLTTKRGFCFWLHLLNSVKSICPSWSVWCSWTRNSPCWHLCNIGQNIFVTLSSWFQCDIWWEGKEKISSDVTEQNGKTPDEKIFRPLEEYKQSSSSARLHLCLTVDIIQKVPEAGRQSTYQAVRGKALLGHIIFPPWSKGEGLN